MDRTFAFRLPIAGYPQARVTTDYALSRARVVVEDVTLLEVPSRQALLAGATAALPSSSSTLELRASIEGDVHLIVDGVAAWREDELRAPPSRSAWAHASIALSGSALGFIASYLYVLRADASGDPWAMKMATHMAVWHLLLTLTLFPMSVWGQRTGIRAVQAVSAIFFFIHLGIAIANVADGTLADGPFVAALNALSGVGFLAALIYGQRAHADMDPLSRLPTRVDGTPSPT
jgi:hypothetical protein